MAPKGLHTRSWKRAADAAGTESSRKTRRTTEGSPRVRSEIHQVERGSDLTERARNPVFTLPPSGSNRERSIVLRGSSSMSGVVPPPCGRHTRFPYGKISTDVSHENRALVADAVANANHRFNPEVRDGDGKFVHLSARALEDPLVAGMVFNQALPNDVADLREIADEDGLGAVAQDCALGVYGLVARLAVIMDVARLKEKEMDFLAARVAELESAVDGERASQDGNFGKAKISSLESEVTRLENIRKEQAVALKRYESKLMDFSAMEEELRQSRAEVVELREEVSKARALSDSYVNNCQITVNRYERVIKEHRRHCRRIAGEADAMFTRPASEFETRDGISSDEDDD